MKTFILLACLCVSGVLQATDYTLYFIRHFERYPTGSDPELTSKGHEHAKHLADLLDNVGLKTIYSSDYLRTRQSVAPVADKLNIDITLYNTSELEELAKKLVEKAETALIVGHSNTTPNMVNLVGGKAKPLTYEDYGDVFIVKFSGKEAKSHLKVTLND